jgi:Protein of unknown function (DUF1573)
MKVYVLIFIVIVLFSCAGKKSNREINKTIQPTEVKFDEEMHNFGKLTSGEIIVYTFVFTNTGKHDLVIENTETDCGCVKVHYSKVPVKPNEKGKIEIEFDTSGMVGRQLKTIEIQANCKEPKHLIIFAEVENKELEIKF